MDYFKQYGLILVIAAWFFYKWWNAKQIIKKLPKLKEMGAKFIDVRSNAEFLSGNAPGTINIPLNELNQRVKEIESGSPIIVCCATGTRSGMAKIILKKNGHPEVYNIGSWTKLL